MSLILVSQLYPPTALCRWSSNLSPLNFLRKQLESSHRTWWDTFAAVLAFKNSKYRRIFLFDCFFFWQIQVPLSQGSSVTGSIPGSVTSQQVVSYSTRSFKKFDFD